MQNLLIFQPRRTNCILRGLTPTKNQFALCSISEAAYLMEPLPQATFTAPTSHAVKHGEAPLGLVVGIAASHYIHDFLIIALWVNERVVNSTHTSWLVDNKFVHLLCGLWRWNRHTMLNRM